MFVSDDIDKCNENAISGISDVNVADGQSVIDDLIISSSASESEANANDSGSTSESEANDDAPSSASEPEAKDNSHS